MSNAAHFLARWARLKRNAGATGEAAPPQGAVRHDAAATGVVAGANAAAPAFDPTSLPSLETITADSDIRMFLQSGVPPRLAAAALRRAWASDPLIRNFIGIADNQWDFTNPATIPGFGSLPESTHRHGLVVQTAATLETVPERLATASVRHEMPVPPGPSRPDVQHGVTEERTPTRATSPRRLRRHGAALPEQRP